MIAFVFNGMKNNAEYIKELRRREDATLEQIKNIDDKIARLRVARSERQAALDRETSASWPAPVGPNGERVRVFRYPRP